MHKRVSMVLAYLAFIGMLLPGLSVSAEQQAMSPCDWTAEREEADLKDLSGRLGSSQGDFQAAYGEPDVEHDVLPEYEFDGCHHVKLTLTPAGHVGGFALYAPRTTLEGG